ncbi:MAG: hypothetical protein GXO85_09115, partial [Chlorobi bacterium]|nr:hypothetical protein [Chlorobiota bacterium]
MKKILIISLLVHLHLFSQNLYWQKYENNPILETSNSNWENYFTAIYCLKDGTGYKLYYTAMVPNQKEVALATSSDGFTWTKHSNNPVLRRGEQSWSSFRLVIGSVLKVGKTYYAFYYGDNENLYAKGSLGVATSSDGVNWTQYDGNPIIHYTDISPGDQGLGLPKVVYKNGQFHMYFIQKGHNRWIYATSSDGFNWDIYENNNINLPNGINVIRYDGTLYYAIRQIANNDSAEIWLSEDGMKWEVQPPSALLPYQSWQTTDRGTKQGYFSLLVENESKRLLLFFNSALGIWGYKKMGMAVAENIYIQNGLTAPSNLIALAEDKAVKLNWQDNSADEDGFIIERKKGQNGTWQEIHRTDPNIVKYKDFSIEQEYI